MYSNDKFYCVSMPELFEYPIKNISDDIKCFSCKANYDIEHFIHDNAVDFAKRHQSITYLIYDKFTNKISAYFSLSIKPINVSLNTISNTTLKKIERICDANYDDKVITPAAYLIAQLGKNDGSNIKIDDIFYFIDTYIEDIQNSCGGVIEFLESENAEKLVKLYENKGFKKFNVRPSKSGEDRKLIQMYRLI